MSTLRTLLLLCWSALAVAAAESRSTLDLLLRTIPSRASTNAPITYVEKTVHWDPSKTAMIICDMWDHHWCQGATARVAEMAPRMNEVIRAARERGVLIIHAPSGTMEHYANTPQRKRAHDAPRVTPPVPLGGWCSLDLAKEGPLPIDDSDGGCDDQPQCQQGSPWRAEIATLEIAPEDAVTDQGPEIYDLLQQSGIENVILMGVHANMCVLGRPFGIRQMVKLGKHVVLLRDLTDTMYDSRQPPYVSHFRGTDLVIAHIEEHWCPSITSSVFTGRAAFHFAADHRAPEWSPEQAPSAP